MTVRELVAALKALPPDARVVVDGYEGGYDDVDIVSKIRLRINAHGEWYFGKHESAWLDEKADEEGVYIGTRRREGT